MLRSWTLLALAGLCLLGGACGSRGAPSLDLRRPVDLGADIAADAALPDTVFPDIALTPDGPAPDLPPLPAGWAVQMGASHPDDFTGIAVDSAGNTYVAGNFTGTSTCGGMTLTSKGGKDLFVAKLSKSGAFLWALAGGGNGDDLATSVAVDSKGNSYVAGWFHGTATIGTTTLTSNGIDDLFVAKLSPGGAVVWAVSAGGSYPEWNTDIVVDSAGNSFITGSYKGKVAFGSTTLDAAESDAYVAKLSPTGAFLWAAGFGAGSGYSPKGSSAIALGSGGELYITGAFYSGATFGTTPLASNGGSDLFVAKLNPKGAAIWAVGGGGKYFDQGRDVVVDGAGNCYVTGSYLGTATFGAATLTTTSTLGDEALVARIDKSGAFDWVIGTSSSNGARGGGLAVNKAGSVYAAGSFSGTLKLGAKTISAAPYSGAYVAKLGATGAVLWATTGGSSAVWGHDIALDSAGNSHLVGMFMGKVTLGGTPLSSPGIGTFAWKIMTSASPGP